MPTAMLSRPNMLSRWAHRAPVVVFLTGTFVWAWALWGYWLPNMPATGLVISPAFVVTAIIGGLAPSLAALGTSWLLGGRAVVLQLLGGLTRFRAPPVQYLLAFGIVPASALVSTILLPIFVGPLKPADPAIMMMALVWPLMAALGEELGWRGFLFPRLADRFGLVGAALVVGAIWGCWHLPADFVGLKGYGDLFWPAFLINGPLVLTAHALIMAWLWRRSGGNLLLMVLYHWSVTTSAMLMPSAGGQDGAGLASSAISAAVLSVVAIGLWLWEVRQSSSETSRRPRQGSAAPRRQS